LMGVVGLVSNDDAKAQSPGINAPYNSGIITNNQSGGTNVIAHPAAGMVRSGRLADNTNWIVL